MLYISYGLIFAIGITGVGTSAPAVISRWFIRNGDSHQHCHGWHGPGNFISGAADAKLHLASRLAVAYIALAVFAVVTIILRPSSSSASVLRT
jgi:hypothetical protein